MEQIIYRLKGGLQPVSYQLPLKETFVKKIIEKNGKKNDLGYRRIKYVPGTDTIFAEDIKGDLQPQSIWFEYGDVKVRTDDVLLNRIMTLHPWFNKRYEIWSEELATKTNLENLRFKGDARRLIDDSAPERIKAIALAVFGVPALGWNDDKCELELRVYADEKPKKLKSVMSEQDYESKLLAGQAFVYDIVKENIGKTAVIWSDTDGVILKLAKGEKGVVELGRFLSTQTDDSELVVQSIGERLERIMTDTLPPDTDEIIDNKDREIAELKAKLAAQTGEKTESVDNDLMEARKKYEVKFNKQVPHNMKNNLEWLNNKLGDS